MRDDDYWFQQRYDDAMFAKQQEEAMTKGDDRDKPMSDEQTRLEVERLRQKLNAPKGSDLRRVESRRAAMARLRPKP